MKYTLTLAVLLTLTSLGAQTNIYWASVVKRGIERAHINGQAIELFVDDVLAPRGLAIDKETGSLYFIDGARNTIERVDLSTGDGREVLHTASGSPSGLSLDFANKYLYFTIPFDSEINRLDLSDNSVTTILNARNVPITVVYSEVDNRLYWVEDGVKLWRSNPDGSAVEEIYQGSILRFDLDIENDHIFWTSRGDELVYRSDLNGENITTLSAASPDVNGLKLDVKNEHLYWAESEAGRIFRCDLDGDNIISLIRHEREIGYIQLDLEPLTTSANIGNLDHEIDLKLYPNPASTFLIIRSEYRIVSYNVLSIDGKSVMSANVSDSAFELDCTPLPNGTYTIQVKTDAGLWTEKFSVAQ